MTLLLLWGLAGLQFGCGRGLAVCWKHFPGCVQIKLPELLRQLHRLGHHALQLVVIAHLQEQEQRSSHQKQREKTRLQSPANVDDVLVGETLRRSRTTPKRIRLRWIWPQKPPSERSFDPQRRTRLHVSGQREVLPEGVTLEAVVRQDAPQVRVVGEEHTKHVPHLNNRPGSATPPTGQSNTASSRWTRSLKLTSLSYQLAAMWTGTAESTGVSSSVYVLTRMREL